MNKEKTIIKIRYGIEKSLGFISNGFAKEMATVFPTITDNRNSLSMKLLLTVIFKIKPIFYFSQCKATSFALRNEIK